MKLGCWVLFLEHFYQDRRQPLCHYITLLDIFNLIFGVKIERSYCIDALVLYLMFIKMEIVPSKAMVFRYEVGLNIFFLLSIFYIITTFSCRMGPFLEMFSSIIVICYKIKCCVGKADGCGYTCWIWHESVRWCYRKYYRQGSLHHLITLWYSLFVVN